jgi:hypothetical protein
MTAADRVRLWGCYWVCPMLREVELWADRTLGSRRVG